LKLGISRKPCYQATQGLRNAPGSGQTSKIRENYWMFFAQTRWFWVKFLTPMHKEDFSRRASGTFLLPIRYNPVGSLQGRNSKISSWLEIWPRTKEDLK